MTRPAERSYLAITPSIQLFDETVDHGTGLRFTATDCLGAADRITVRSRGGTLIDQLDPADLDPDKTIEEVANDWLDEHRPGWEKR